MASADRARRPFWLHQAAEYVVGVALIAQGLQAAEPLVPGVAGGLIVLNAAVAKGPLSAFHVVGRRVHRIIDVLLIVGLVAAAGAPGVETSMRMVLVAFAIVLGFVARYTRYETRDERRAAVRNGHGAAPGAAEATVGDRAEELGRRAGRLAGHGVRAWRTRR